MNAVLYVWRDGAVVSYIDSELEALVPCTFHYLECVDMRFDYAEKRYGRFTPNGWKHCPVEKFPAEFRTHLLLLGVS